MNHSIQRITVLGATGSIGASTLDVVARHPDRYRVFALTGNRRVREMAALCVRHRPEVVVMGSAHAAHELEVALHAQGLKTAVVHGQHQLCRVASSDACDTVMAAIVGAAGLEPSLAAVRAGKKMLLANKEALVMSGQLFLDAVACSNATLLPIDSEHNAIFQCLPQGYARNPSEQGIDRIILTASGGPFLRRDLATFASITPAEAVAHPNWVMGRKISVDSATMMNKGLEVIEAYWLFGVAQDQIEVVIHSQSVIHSMVSYVDGSVLAQLGSPDMRTPIAHALAYPQRIAAGVKPLDFMSLAKLEFMSPELERFPCLGLAYDALKLGGSAPAILNAGNEMAVEAFLEGKIEFHIIPEIISRVLEGLSAAHCATIPELLEIDRQARELARKFISS